MKLETAEKFPKETLVPPACACFTCKTMCFRPCIPTPAEAEWLIERGHAKKLMLKWTVNAPRQFNYLLPANPGLGGKLGGLSQEEYDAICFAMRMGCGDVAIAQSRISSGCVFQSASGSCGLHRKGLKPTGGMLAHHDDRIYEPFKVHDSLHRLWDTPHGEAMVLRWRMEVRCFEEPPKIRRQR